MAAADALDPEEPVFEPPAAQVRLELLAHEPGHLALESSQHKRRIDATTILTQGPVLSVTYVSGSTQALSARFGYKDNRTFNAVRWARCLLETFRPVETSPAEFYLKLSPQQTGA